MIIKSRIFKLFLVVFVLTLLHLACGSGPAESPEPEPVEPAPAERECPYEDPIGICSEWFTQGCQATVTAIKDVVQMSYDNTPYSLSKNQEYLLVKDMSLQLSGAGQADITYGNGNKFTIYAPADGSSQIKITEWNGSKDVLLSAGSSHVVEKASDTCKVTVFAETEDGEIEIVGVGTEFFVSVTNDNQVQVAVSEGTVEVTDALGEFVVLKPELLPLSALIITNGQAGEAFELEQNNTQIIQYFVDGRDILGSPISTILDRPFIPPSDLQLPPDMEGTITIWYTWEADAGTSLLEAIDVFTSKYPNITIESRQIPYTDFQNQFINAIAAGEGPLLMIAPSDWGPEWFDQGLLGNFWKWASDDLLNSLNPGAVQTVQYNGAILGLPLTIEGTLLFRNKRIIPQAPSDLDELIYLSQTATEAGYIGAYLDFGFYFFAPHLYGLGGRLMDIDGNPVFNNSVGIEWMELIQQFQRAGLTTSYSNEDIDQFQSGSVGFVIDGNWNIARFSDSIGPDNLSIDAWPYPLSGFVASQNVYLNLKATDDTELQKVAWEFMKYLVSEEAQLIFSDWGLVPSLRNINLSDPLVRDAMEIFDHNISLPVIPEMGVYWVPLNEALNKVANGEMTPKEALEYAESIIWEELAAIRDQ